MSAFRHGLAVVLLAAVPPVVLFWLIIHPFVRFWRKTGPVVAYAAAALAVAGAGWFLGAQRDRLLGWDLGTSRAAIGIASILAVAALGLGLAHRRVFPVRCLLGLPELAPDRHRGRLVVEGIYARIRHPRYAEMTLTVFACALIANYPSSYAVAALWLLGMRWVVAVEERELRARFGAAYDDYCRRVPRFIPRRGSARDG